VALLVAIGAIAISGDALARPVCPDRSPERHAYFGDLHIHTGLSADAMLFGTTNRPDDAYRWSRGGKLSIKSTHGSPIPIEARLARPLDFAAVTDHAENIGTVSLCTTPGSAAYDTESCQLVRAPLPTDSMSNFAATLGRVFQTMYFSEEICGPDRERCREAVKAPWREIQEAAARWNDACEFTTFVAYEYSPTPMGSKLHHNVVFRNETVMDAPISSRDVPEMIDLWKLLKQGCKDAGTGCDVLAIPHNSNLGNGQMFNLDYGGERDPARQREIAALRSEIEPLVEIFQQKGSSECANGLWNIAGAPDELCDFEQYRDWRAAVYEDCRDGRGEGALEGRGCVSRLDFTRMALAAGLAEQRRIGANPHRFGVIGSTDAHDGTAADVDEWVHDGRQRPTDVLEPGRKTTGGLAAVWAEENTREAIFEAMLRREVFATSGTRLRVRFFGAPDLPEDLCGDPSLAKRGYAMGVPMGGELSVSPGATSPGFVVSAMADPGTEERPGAGLERIQIVKVWAGRGDVLHQSVHDVARREGSGRVDLATCERASPGPASLCGVWRDPDFDPGQGAAYYARVVEDPSCRHTGYACTVAADAERPGHCDDPAIPKQIRERAWTSPIWVTPEASMSEGS